MTLLCAGRYLVVTIMLGFLLSLSLASQQEAPAPPADAALEDVVVTASRAPQPPYDVVADFVTYCYDANRLNGRARSPEGEGLWEVMDPTEASRLGVPPTGQAFILDTERIKLVFFIDEGRGSQSRRQHACTITAIGRHDPSVIEADLARLMGRGGSSTYTTYTDLFPVFVGWRQRGWSAIPRRGSIDWTAFGDHPENFVVAVRPQFYSRSTWVVTELRTREDHGVPTTAIKLTHFFKP